MKDKVYIITREVTTYEYLLGIKNVVAVEKTIINNTVYGTRDEARAYLCEEFQKEMPQFIDEGGKLMGCDDEWMKSGGLKKTETRTTSQDTVYKIVELAVSHAILNQSDAILTH